MSGLLRSQRIRLRLLDFFGCVTTRSLSLGMACIELCGMCGPDLRSMHASRRAAPVLYWAWRPTTAACSRRPGMPSCGLPMRAGYLMSSGRVWRNLAHKHCTVRTLMLTASPIAPLAIRPLASSRTIHRTCDTSSLDTARTRELPLKHHLSPPPPYPVTPAGGMGALANPLSAPSFPLRGRRALPAGAAATPPAGAPTWPLPVPRGGLQGWRRRCPDPSARHGPAPRGPPRPPRYVPLPPDRPSRPPAPASVRASAPRPPLAGSRLCGSWASAPAPVEGKGEGLLG